MQDMLEMWVQSSGGEDPLEEGMATYSSILAWRVPMDRRAWQGRVHGGEVTKSWAQFSRHTHTYTHTQIAYKFSISGLSRALESASL